MTYYEIVLFVRKQIATNAVIDENANTVTMDRNGVDRIAEAVAEEICKEPKPKKIKRFLFVEDGSVDFEELETRIEMTNPETYLIRYRQGSAKPELVEVKE